LAKNSPIEWCDDTWPVLNGCRRVSEGCRHCYAEQLVATRLRQTPKYKGLAVYTDGGPRWTGESRLWLPHLDEPLRIRKPKRIFVCNMGDLFFEGNSNEDIAAVFGVMAASSQHVFQVLTKRPQRAAEWFEGFAAAGGASQPVRAALAARARGITDERVNGCIDGQFAPWPLRNVWLGVSVENQETADERIPALLRLPAALRFISAEPLLSPIDLTTISERSASTANIVFTRDALRPNAFAAIDYAQGNRLDWVIVGGESGHDARPFDLAWARSLGEQCAAAGVAYFFKQGGKSLACEHDRKGGCLECLPQLSARQFPTLPGVG